MTHPQVHGHSTRQHDCGKRPSWSIFVTETTPAIPTVACGKILVSGALKASHGFRSAFCLASLVFSAATLAAQPAPSGAVAIVVKLYRDFAWEAVIVEPRQSEFELLRQPREVLARYFDENLVSLLMKDRACVETTHEICNLDYLPMWAGQDPGAYELKVMETNDPHRISVNFIYPVSARKAVLSYRVSKTSAGWRVSDILQGDENSLLTSLSSEP